ncbi:hypothetical protein L596_000422 [Steinernema carpocapsae]|uniref:Uncharacterized protein n=1 Tax=Steinernema carpocapsae TaxID=34508 RepID=A0A4V6I742_STECR|nr:hypothetical protein L596_000422 [Steinernema carpocapsae]
MRTPFLSSDSVSNTMISVYLQLGVLLILCMAIAVECTYKCIQYKPPSRTDPIHSARAVDLSFIEQRKRWKDRHCADVYGPSAAATG